MYVCVCEREEIKYKRSKINMNKNQLKLQVVYQREKNTTSSLLELLFNKDVLEMSGTTAKVTDLQT